MTNWRLAVGCAAGGCGSDTQETSGFIDNGAERIQILGTTVPLAELSVVCTTNSDGMEVAITGPDGTRAVAVREVGAQASDVVVVTPTGETRTLENGALWESLPAGEGFIIDEKYNYDEVLYLYEGFAGC